MNHVTSLLGRIVVHLLPQRLLAAWCMLGCLASFAPPSLAQAPAGTGTAPPRVALVIGNAAYTKGAELRNPVNDARAMAATLRQAGFRVISRENASKQQMEQAVGEFGRALEPGTVALFYFAGHGMQVNGRNFLLPVDAQVATEQALRLEALDVDVVLEQVAAARTNVNLVILDACRNNPFERRFRSTSGGLAQIDAPKGTLIAYATAPGKVAADGEGSNGLYTAKLIEAIRTPGVQLEEVFKRVRIEVARASGDRQTPWEASSLVGSFYFFGPTTIAAAPVAAAPATVDREALHWQSVKDTNDPAQVQTYLDQYPNGAFAGLARARLAALQRAAVTAPAPGTGAHPFDGTWHTVLRCERGHDGARAYTWRFPVVVRESRLAGEHRNPRNTGAIRLSGVIAPDGSATLEAQGTTGDEDFSIGRLRPGTNYGYTVSARFEGHQGSGRRNEQRACQFAFTRQ